MKTWQLKKQFTIVATAADKCPLVEILKPEYVGQANVFVSHAYSYDLRDSIECMLRYEEEHPGSIYWFDPFSLNQHPTPSGKVPTEELISAFGDRIEEFEATLIVASPWDNPAFLARAWCLFEFMCSHNAKKPITIMLPRKQEEAFVKDLGDNWQVLHQALARIDSRTAQAKEQDDLQAINQEIQVTVTHHELNKMALTSMREWLVKTGLEQERRLRADKDRKRFLDFQYPLSIMLRQMGQLKAGVRVAKECLQGHEETLGPKHPETLTSVGRLALLLQDQGKLDEAEPLYRRDLQGCEETLGPKHLDTLISVGNLASLLKAQGKLDEAEPLCRRALEGKEETLGPKHPDTLASVGNLALLLQAQGKLDEAEPLWRRALEGSEETLGPKHPDTVNVSGNLGSLLMKKSDSSQQKLGRSMVQDCLKSLREQHKLPSSHRWIVKFEKVISLSSA
jgi:tetratricopeptide (TPR) repeat protein